MLQRYSRLVTPTPSQPFPPTPFDIAVISLEDNKELYSEQLSEYSESNIVTVIQTSWDVYQNILFEKMKKWNFKKIMLYKEVNKI